MIMLRKLMPLRCASTRLLETKSSVCRKLIAEPLTERELVRVRGNEVVAFLQGLITNDMAHLHAGQSSKISSMYTVFLNKAGRVLYDTIIYHTAVPNTYLIECDKNVTSDLKRHLRLYRVRRKIDIDSIDQELTPCVVFNPDASAGINTTGLSSADALVAPDPRIRELGVRVLMPTGTTWADLANLFEKHGKQTVVTPTKESNYLQHRYCNGVGEGVIDLPPGKCFALEANCDFLHGVSFHKGCYIGQELTARVYHTGVIRKRLMPLRLTARVPDEATAVTTMAGTNVGTLRGTSFDRALALMRVEKVLNLNELMIDGVRCIVEKPRWWPTELASKASMREGQ